MLFEVPNAPDLWFVKRSKLVWRSREGLQGLRVYVFTLQNPLGDRSSGNTRGYVAANHWDSLSLRMGLTCRRKIDVRSVNGWLTCRLQHVILVNQLNLDCRCDYCTIDRIDNKILHLASSFNDGFTSWTRFHLYPPTRNLCPIDFKNYCPRLLAVWLQLIHALWIIS